jgi:hypothetical protein
MVASVTFKDLLPEGTQSGRDFVGVRHIPVDLVKIAVRLNEALRLANCESGISGASRQSQERGHVNRIYSEVFANAIGVHQARVVVVRTRSYHEELIRHELQGGFALCDETAHARPYAVTDRHEILLGIGVNRNSHSFKNRGNVVDFVMVGRTERFCRQKNGHPASTKLPDELHERPKKSVHKGVVMSIPHYQVCAEKRSTASLEEEGTVHSHRINRRYHSL